MKPSLARTVAEVRARIREARQGGRTVGLVPTMGALHEGHGSLIRAARAETGFVVVSVFVNPMQFGPNEDLARYPRRLEQDIDLCGREGAALVFAPALGEMYPAGFRSLVEVTGLQDQFCGAARPGHFRGVTTVVLKLFNMVQPDVAYFGQKDAQQAQIIMQMTADLNLPLRVRVCPIVREADGLAMSSRNEYLSPSQRRQATVLSRALREAQELIGAGEEDASVVRSLMASRVRAAPDAQLDYAEIVDAETLKPVDRLAGEALLLLAVRFGATRLIDNLRLTIPAPGSRNPRE